jgi:hypothetical protein
MDDAYAMHPSYGTGYIPNHLPQNALREFGVCDIRVDKREQVTTWEIWQDEYMM